MATSGASLPVDVAARTAAWDVALPDLSQRVLTQWCAPLANVRGTQNKATVLGILYAALHEQQQRRPGYDAFMAADPSAVREVALHLPDEPAFNAYIHLEAARRVLHELRQLQLRALGYREQPALFESVEELHARLQREEHQQALLRVVPPRARPVAPELAALFLPHVDVPMLLAALQRQEVLTPEGYWNGDWGKANDLMALVVAWQDGK